MRVVSRTPLPWVFRKSKGYQVYFLTSNEFSMSRAVCFIIARGVGLARMGFVWSLDAERAVAPSCPPREPQLAEGRA